jgi:hypothetical protein
MGGNGRRKMKLDTYRLKVIDNGDYLTMQRMRRKVRNTNKGFNGQRRYKVPINICQLNNRDIKANLCVHDSELNPMNQRILCNPSVNFKMSQHPRGEQFLRNGELILKSWRASHAGKPCILGGVYN